jgi:hypothetical protein
VNADLGAAQAADMRLGLVRADTIKLVSLLMIDALHFEAFMQAIPCATLVGVSLRSLRDVTAE